VCVRTVLKKAAAEGQENSLALPCSSAAMT
jgi:hypothetical protein